MRRCDEFCSSKLNAAIWCTVIVRPNGSHSKRYTFLGHLRVSWIYLQWLWMQILERISNLCAKNFSILCQSHSSLYIFSLFGLSKVQNGRATEKSTVFCWYYCLDCHSVCCIFGPGLINTDCQILLIFSVAEEINWCRFYWTKWLLR